MANDIFLSYSRADRPLAEQFVRVSSERGLAVWFDERLEGGEDWRERIVEAVGGAKALVILFSDHSNQSDQLIKELAVADSLKKRVIPVLVADCQPRGAYLYELASRHWLSIHPNPDTRLGPLIDSLMTELDLRRDRPAAVPVVVPTVAPAREVAPAAAAVMQTPAAAKTGPWFPLGRYDLFIVVPILIIAFLTGVLGNGEDKYLGLGLSVISASIYLLVIAARNARLNRSITSWQSFASYAVVLIAGISPVFVAGASAGENAAAFVGLMIVSIFVATLANGFQVILRKVFALSTFRRKVVRPVG